MNRREICCGIIIAGVTIGLFLAIVTAAPEGPDSIAIQSNETKTVTNPQNINHTGAYIKAVNLSATVQNSRWKGILGQLTGSLSLADAGNSQIYNWELSSISGEVFATRNSSTIAWNSVQCANNSLLETENDHMGHTNSDDNISRTFNDSTHSQIVVASNTILANSCPTLNTYINSSSQDSSFEEIIITDSTNFTNGGNLIYTTIVEQNAQGFDSETYDFQMITAENGTSGFSSITPYFVYVELS